MSLKRYIDPLFGIIELTEVERKIVEHPLFQRLHHLKQLGNAIHIFPGASHTRFQHSLGVLYTTQLIIDKLINNSDSDSDKAIIKDRIQLLRLAALLHDIGHYPYSHQIETVYQNIFGKDEAHHENMSVFVVNETPIKDILNNYGFGDDERDIICGCINGAGSSWERQIIKSDLDADGLDYCLRDSYNAGIKYGQYDINYLFNSTKLAKQKCFCFDKKAIHTIDHYVYSKFMYYLQVLFHPRRIFLEQVLQYLVYNLIIEYSLPNLDTYKNNFTNGNYLDNTDEIFFNKMRNTKNDNLKHLFHEVFLTGLLPIKPIPKKVFLILIDIVFKIKETLVKE